MSLLNILKENKGTVSSALGKELAKEALSGKNEILGEALQLIHFDNKNVRSGAAKIIEKVAEVNPEFVANELSDLARCMNYPEPQTRWMVLHIAGLCAYLKPNISRDFFEEAIKYLDKKHGTVLNDRAITYFGYMGAVSNSDCKKCFPYLISSFVVHQNRITRIFESLNRMIENMDNSEKRLVVEYADKYEKSESSAIKIWAKKIKRKLKEK